MLVKALAAFFILVYIHISYSQTPATCLSNLKTEGWPRDGILRVEILRPGEIKIPLKDGAEDMSEELTHLRINNKGGLVSIDPSTTLPHEQHNPNDPAYKNLNSKTLTVSSDLIDANQTVSDEIGVTEHYDYLEPNVTDAIEIDISESVSSTMLVDSSNFNGDSISMTDSEMNTRETYSNETIAKINDMQMEGMLKTDIPEVEKLMNAVFPDDQYVVECKFNFNVSFIRDKNFLIFQIHLSMGFFDYQQQHVSALIFQ